LGGSGALSLALAQLHYGLDIAVNDSNFINNFGIRGGIIIILFTGINNTHVTFDNCLFNRNAMTVINDVRLPKSIQYYVPCRPKRDVVVSLLNSNFTNNVASLYNCSLIVFSHYNSGVNSINEVVNFYIDGCIFLGNKALLGSAILIYEHKISGLDVGMQVSIKDTDFIKNENKERFKSISL
jgi:hypothetical protein